MPHAQPRDIPSTAPHIPSTAPHSSKEDLDPEVGPRKGNGGKGTYKIQIQLNSRQKARLYDLRDTTDAESATQVVREALKIYEYIIDKTVKGDSKLFFQDQSTGTITEVLI